MTNILTATEKDKLDNFCETYRFNDGAGDFNEAQFAYCLSNIVNEKRFNEVNNTLAFKDFEEELERNELIIMQNYYAELLNRKIA